MKHDSVLNVQYALLSSPEPLTALQLRDLFEQFKTSIKSPELIVFLDAPYETVGKMQQMCELYGW